MTITILEQVRSNDDLYRKEREKYLIQNFNTFYICYVLKINVMRSCILMGSYSGIQTLNCSYLWPVVTDMAITSSHDDDDQ